jgi:acetyltransferase
MSVIHLDGFFHPRRIALIGPAALPPPVMSVLLDRLTAPAGHPEIILVGVDVPDPAPAGLRHVADIARLDAAPDLAILVCAPADAPLNLADLARLGTRAVLIVSPGYDAWPQPIIDAMFAIARPVNLRLIGPGSLGVIVPRVGLDASLAAGAVAKGDVALVTRSAAMLNATLAWGRTHRVGFSAVVSLGAKVDVDIGDLLDQLAQDPATKAILVHLEVVSAPGKFMSAARAAARSKPVIVIRTGASRDRRSRGETVVARLAYPDAVYDAAFRRAGLLRVDTLDALFEAVETVTRLKPVVSRRVAVVANGTSISMLAADHLVQFGAEAPDLSDATRARLTDLSRVGYRLGAAITLGNAATPETYVAALQALNDDPGTDAIILAHAPHCLVPSRTIAEAVASFVRERRRRQARVKPVIAAVLDDEFDTRAVLEEAGIPCHVTPEAAVRSWAHLNRFAEAQEHLMAIPQSLPPDFVAAPATAAAAVETATTEDGWLDHASTDAILEAYGLARPDGWEMETDFVVGIVDDSVFGPVLIAAIGDTFVEKMSFRVLDLVPIDLNLAQGLCGRLADLCMLSGKPLAPEAVAALPLMLTRLAQMAVDLPALGEIQLDLRVESTDISVVRARLRRAPETAARPGRLGHPRLAIRPYPKEWERHIAIETGERLFIRPVRPEDEALYPEFLSHCTAEDMRLRFFAPVKEFSHAFLARLTQLDYARAVAFAAIDEAGQIGGVVRLHADPDHRVGEYAILLRSDLKGKGLGKALMQLIIDWARADGIELVKGEVLRANAAMLGMCRDLGFHVHASPDDESIAEAVYTITDAAAPAPSAGSQNVPG